MKLNCFASPALTGEADARSQRRNGGGTPGDGGEEAGDRGEMRRGDREVARRVRSGVGEEMFEVESELKFVVNLTGDVFQVQ